MLEINTVTIEIGEEVLINLIGLSMNYYVISEKIIFI